MIRYILNIILLFILSLYCFNGHAKKSEGPIKKQLNALETHVRQTHDLKFIAQCLSQTKTFEEWPKNFDPKLKLYVAIKWFEQKNFKESAELLDSIDPFGDYSELWMYYRATILIHLGYVSESLPLIAKLEAAHPKNKEVLYLKSLYLTQSGDLTGALELMGKIIKKNKKDGAMYLQRGAMQMLAFSYDLAIKDYKKALKYLPQNEIAARQQALLQLGLIYFKIKFDEKMGKEFLKKGVELDPNSAMVEQTKKALQR